MPRPAKAVPIDLVELASALEDHSGLAWYLDAENGDLVPVPDDVDDDALPVPRDEIEGSARFVFVEPIESHEGWDEMRDFTATIDDRRLGELLAVALAGKGAFRRFRQVLAGHPEERTRWIAEHDRRMQDRAREWLDAQGIAWTARRGGTAAPGEAPPPTHRRGGPAIQPGPADTGQASGQRERCEMCSEHHLNDLWIEVTPEGAGISRVTVDVTLRLCPDHRRRLIEALGRRDADEIEPPKYHWK